MLKTYSAICSDSAIAPIPTEANVKITNTIDAYYEKHLPISPQANFLPIG
jgi:hypothetical protein